MPPKDPSHPDNPGNESERLIASISGKGDGSTLRAVAVVTADTFKTNINSLTDGIQFRANGVGCTDPEAAATNLAAIQDDLLDAECGRYGPKLADAIIAAQVARAKCQRVDVASDATPEKCIIRAKNRGWSKEPK